MGERNLCPAIYEHWDRSGRRARFPIVLVPTPDQRRGVIRRPTKTQLTQFPVAHNIWLLYRNGRIKRPWTF